MLDGWVRGLIDPPLARAGVVLARAGVSADAVTVVALAFGLAGAAAAAAGWFGSALALFLAGRVCDGLDGAVARAAGRTERGGLIDIVADFAVYGAVPLAFAAYDPAANALPGAALLFAFYVNGASFLAFAAVAARRGLETTSRGVKSIYFTAGLAEGTETIAVFVAMLVWPSAFPALALAFAALCLVTAVSRVALAWKTFA
ncbi:CDP-alcohol phosphatidyltransferase family protein [Alsobacter sp. SYSU M60028]|uniref:CDP-alcohol phosphatidyltransferase family protein n=1 Tax=Alsobacter ponti TaxID=2962936 RepID=A0ABT1LHU5_9HYPH|nr:CDP-alcohol phosphatidyltransferase family protein [Alsobacter ponti]MCP8941087.1 CDP-alcohol phosphatidyltransferase family protein [Alsobacter ponti]